MHVHKETLAALLNRITDKPLIVKYWPTRAVYMVRDTQPDEMGLVLCWRVGRPGDEPCLFQSEVSQWVLL